MHCSGYSTGGCEALQNILMLSLNHLKHSLSSPCVKRQFGHSSACFDFFLLLKYWFGLLKNQFGDLTPAFPTREEKKNSKSINIPSPDLLFIAFFGVGGTKCKEQHRKTKQGSLLPAEHPKIL